MRTSTDLSIDAGIGTHAGIDRNADIERYAHRLVPTSTGCQHRAIPTSTDLTIARGLVQRNAMQRRIAAILAGPLRSSARMDHEVLRKRTALFSRQVSKFTRALLRSAETAD